MPDSLIVPAVLSGGAGSRLWPLSRKARPKQFHTLAGGEMMLSETLLRLREFRAGEVAPPLVLGNAAHLGLSLEALDQAGAGDGVVILEPEGRNTAPAAAVACRYALSLDPEALVLIAPADHHIGRPAEFCEVLAAGAPLAAEGRIVTFGITPDGPETGFGYIRRGAPLGPGFAVDRFVEKPDRATAEDYLASGDYYWNAGIFLVHAATFLAELDRFRPDILGPADEALAQARREGRVIALDPDAWDACGSESIDYAVAEKTDRAAVVPANVQWNDVGSWASIYEIAAKDAAGNAFVGDVLHHDVRGCYVRAEGGRPVAVVGCEDLVVVDTPEAVCVLPRSAAQNVKKIVEALKKGRTDLL